MERILDAVLPLFDLYLGNATDLYYGNASGVERTYSASEPPYLPRPGTCSISRCGLLPLASTDVQFPGSLPEKQAVFAVAVPIGHRGSQKPL
jgi:hypothetical protein